MKLHSMDKVEAWSAGSILPPGRHVCRIVEVEETTSSNDNPQLVIKSEAILGDHTGSSITDWVVVIPTTYGKVRQILQAAGIEPESGDWDFDPQSLLGCEVAVFVKEEPKHDDPTKIVSKVAGYDFPRGSDVPADTEGLNGGASKADSDIPFARPRIPDHSARRRDLFVGDRVVE